MSGIFSAFPLLTEIENGQTVKFYAPHCDRCDYPTKIRFNGKRLPQEALVGVLRKRGWDTSPRFVCPRCKEGKKPMSPAARRAAYLKLNPPSTQQETVIPIMAEQPKTATPEQRRRIRDALEEHYLEDRGCYSKSWSDKSLAAKLDMPAKWVTDLREANGYGPDVNEAASVRAAEIEALSKDMADLQADILRRFDELERRLKKINLDQSYAA